MQEKEKQKLKLRPREHQHSSSLRISVSPHLPKTPARTLEEQRWAHQTPRLPKSPPFSMISCLALTRASRLLFYTFRLLRLSRTRPLVCSSLVIPGFLIGDPTSYSSCRNVWLDPGSVLVCVISLSANRQGSAACTTQQT